MVDGLFPSTCRAFSAVRVQERRTVYLERLNSATKYPSILTYHGLGERGVLTDEVTEFHGDVVLTEKINGTNGRIILLPGRDYLIGSREEILYAKGDRVYPQKPPESKAIVETLRGLAEKAASDVDEVTTLYLEVYGGKIGREAKQYTKGDATGFRLFDVSLVDLSVLKWDRGRIASWRDEDNGQNWYDEGRLRTFSTALGIPLAPRLGAMHGSTLPSGIEETHKFLSEYLPASGVVLDETGGGSPEGIVIRNSDRSVIAKARFEDYARTMKKRK